MSTEKIFAAVLNDQVVIKLLEELTARVKKLEEVRTRAGKMVVARVARHCPASHVSALMFHTVLLDDEVPYESLPSIEVRANELELSDNRLFSRLQQLGIAGVPADGRIKFKNFWSPSSSSDLTVAIEALDTMY
jgi:hypothetical protein